MLARLLRRGRPGLPDADAAVFTGPAREPAQARAGQQLHWQVVLCDIPRSDLYGFIVAVPGTDVAAVTAVIRQAYDSRSAVGISVAGKLWQAPLARQPFPGQRLQIAFLSKNQALQLYRMLVPSG